MFSAFPLTKMRKAGIFMEPTGTFTYYEDLYGRRNEEEFDEGPIHSCESDDGDEAPEEPSQIRSASSLPVRQVRTPKAKSIQRGARSFGAIKAPGKQRLPTTPISDIEDTSASSPTKPSKRMPASNGHKKLTPRKFGMFGLSATTAEPQAPNSAGEALDDILGADALKVNEGDNEPLEPEKEANETIRGDTPIIQPGGEMSSFPANPYRVDNLVEGAELEIDEGIDENAQNGDLQSASEGDIEDNMSDREENSNGPPRRSLRTSQDRAGAKKSRATTKKTPARVKSNYGLRRTALRNSVASSSGAGKLRRSTRQAQTGGRAERTSTNKAKQIAASNKAKMTARAAAKRWKAGRVDREEYFAAVYGRKSKANRASRPQTGSVSAKEDERAAYFKAVYGRKRRKVKAEEESGQDQGEESEEDGLEAVGVISEAEAKVLESVGGLVEVDGGEVDAEG